MRTLLRPFLRRIVRWLNIPRASVTVEPTLQDFFEAAQQLVQWKTIL